MIRYGTTTRSVGPPWPTTNTRSRPHSASATAGGRYKVDGTTIIEIVMAIVILAIALPPLMASFADASRQTILPAQASVASFLATERMEEIVARRYRGLQAGQPSYSLVTAANYPDEVPVAGFSMYERRVTVAEVTSSLNPSGSPVGYRKVRVTVSWNGGSDHLYVERVFADF